MSNVVQLRDNLQIIPVDTSASEKRYLLSTTDGRHFELSEMMTDVIVTLHQDGDLEQAAGTLSRQWGQPVSPEDLRLIVENYLKKHGLVKTEPASSIEEQTQFLERGRGFDAIYWRLRLVPASALRPLARITRGFYRVDLSIILVATILVVHYVVLREFDSNYLAERIFHSMGSAYLKLYGCLFLCVLWHELGHVSALAKFGKDAKEIGFGVYFVFPVLYTDVSALLDFKTVAACRG